MERYKQQIDDLRAKGLTAKQIQKKVRCSIATVYRHLPKHPKKYNDEGLRWCWKCKRYKPADEFNKDKGTRDGLQHMCKTCNRIQSKARRLAKKGITLMLDREPEYVTINVEY